MNDQSAGVTNTDKTAHKTTLSRIRGPVRPLDRPAANSAGVGKASGVSCCGADAESCRSGGSVTGRTEISPDPRTATARISGKDRWEAVKARLGIRRMDHRVEPGIYALDGPDRESPVFVTANYRLSFDALRAGLSGTPSWLLVLDTRGINVWCAAGKGTFGTAELLRVIAGTGIAGRVSHRRLIVPQLGAVGVSAPKVEAATGFSIQYGPVRARDIGAYLRAGYRKTPEMARVRFTMADRAALIPVELVHSWKPLLLSIGGALLLGLLSVFVGGATGSPFMPDKGTLPPDAAAFLPAFRTFGGLSGLFAVILCGSVLSGTAFVPLLLPFLPGRALSLKGGFLGAVCAGLLSWAFGFHWIAGAALVLVCSGISGFFGLMFTGSTTYTSQSGTEAEMKRFGPFLAISFLVGAGAILTAAAGGLI